MQEFVKDCQATGDRYIAMGADPLAKHQYLGFGWKDVMEGLKRRYLPTA